MNKIRSPYKKSFIFSFVGMLSALTVVYFVAATIVLVQ
ncbi:hypothetical protein MNBD_NITROSPINAE02-900 [hydrothermal vent metagenome]|uniref:Uncharacterized protein n=1 Tax=hydrothermal vent metagenome TaxID=652676 RepID=A0A3B1D2W9_9ZZZZ